MTQLIKHKIMPCFLSLLCLLFLLPSPAFATVDDVVTDPPPEDTEVTSPAGAFIDMGKIALPSGKVGKEITIRFPLIYRLGTQRTSTDSVNSAGEYPILTRLSYLEVAPVIDDPDSFPFDLTRTDYTQRIIYADNNGVMQNAGVYNETFKLRSDLPNGTQTVNFIVRYREVGQSELTEAQVRLFVKVSGARTESTGGGGGNTTPLSTPKLIIKEFKTDPVSVMAGNEFDLILTLSNTSEKQAVQNIKVSLKNTGEEDYILPSSGSSSFYIDKIGAGKEEERRVKMRVRADAPEKVHPLTVALEYEDASASQISSDEQVNVPVKQQVRISLLNAYVQDVQVGMPGSFSMEINNLGRAMLYNVMVTMTGDGFYATQQSLGNIEAGTAKQAELEINAEQAGELIGHVVVSFEDVNGEAQPEETIEQVFTSMGEDNSENDPFIDLENYPDAGDLDTGNTQGGFPWRLVFIIGGIVAALAAVVVLIGIIRKRRRKAMEEYDLD